MIKNAFFGKLVILLVFGSIILGCDDSVNDVLSDKEYLFKNESSYTIIVKNLGNTTNKFTPNNFELTSGSKQKIICDSDFSIFAFIWYRKDTENQNDVKFSDNFDIRTGWFRNN